MVQVSEWNFDPTSLKMLLIMVISRESECVNQGGLKTRLADLKLSFGILHNVGTGTGIAAQVPVLNPSVYHHVHTYFDSVVCLSHTFVHFMHISQDTNLFLGTG